MARPSEDGFADRLIIPENIAVAELKQASDSRIRSSIDSFQQEILKALQKPAVADSSIGIDLMSLELLQKDSLSALKRYLATSPSWRVFTERGNTFATRRWMIESAWRYTLNGYYSRFYVSSHKGIPDFQSRVTIGLSGKPWRGNMRNSTQMKLGETATLATELSPATNRQYESHCLINVDSCVLEVFEQSPAKERVLTKAALTHINHELSPLAKKPTWETIQQMLPENSIQRGQPAFDLMRSYQPGIYESEIWVNPGEAGMIYLKAFEITKGTPLSVNELRESSNEWVGWSDDPNQLFFSNSHFAIYEGDWGKPYAARFEVWFVPDSGAAERKLMEKVFKIEGWQR